mgnify:CR=1 FL=1|tara:strand:- start:705 stop:2078 length:1374 start_codon:yes stop_codon:yes gene_type:complete
MENVMDYDNFIRGKLAHRPDSGCQMTVDIQAMFPFQREIVKVALARGRSAIFADCGLGKTLMQLAWAENIRRLGPVLILAPLGVAHQTAREASKFGINARYMREDDGSDGIIITNYERLDNFDADRFTGVVLDESSILKSFDGKTCSGIIEKFRATPYKLACTATPSPNDYMELGTHCEFLNVMTRAEMLAMYFFHDGGETSEWTIKGHAEDKFWDFVASWSVAISKPSDIGFEVDGYDLPEMNMHLHIIESTNVQDGLLFAMPAHTLHEQRKAKRAGMSKRVELASGLVAEHPDDPWVIWGELNDECDGIQDAVEGSVQVAGSDDPDEKESRLIGFSNGDFNVLISKPRIAGFGMNWQHCHRMIFANLSHSYEKMYQAMRRIHRFGQQNPCDIHVILTNEELPILENIRRKAAQAKTMEQRMTGRMCESMKRIMGVSENRMDYGKTRKVRVPSWMK